MNFAYIRKRLRKLRWPGRRRDQRLLLGRRGERAAARYLRHHQHRVLARNYRCPAGEIDLICADGDTIVFVEIKTRSSEESQYVQDSLHAGQRRRIENAARCYLAQHGVQNRPCRFDMVAIVWPPGGLPRIEHFQDAFQARHA